MVIESYEKQIQSVVLRSKQLCVVNTIEKNKSIKATATISLTKIINPISKINSCKSIRIGKELFVNLRMGSIQQYYRTGVVLGQGAYGKVWKVTHKTTGLVRAMKQLKKSALIKEEEERLLQEMNILRNLDHPNVVKLFELYQDEQNYYLITEFLSGGELFNRIKKE